MSGWGINDRSDAPSWLPDYLKDKVFLTEKGWCMRASGTNNPDAIEVLVALDASVGGVISTGVATDAPTLWEGEGTLTLPTLLGVSGSAIDTFRVEVYDMEDVFTGDGMTLAVSGLPTGLSAATAGDYYFEVTGTPTGATTGTATVEISDSDGNTTGFDISFAITG